MSRGSQQGAHKRRRYLPGFIATTLWMVPLMLVLAAGSFFLARDFFAPNFLQPSKVQNDRPSPIRILSPEEAQKLSKDKASHVWTEGVKDSDIPKLEPERTRDDADRERSRRSTRKPSQSRRTDKPAGTTAGETARDEGPAAEAPAVPEPAAPAPADTPTE